MENSKVTKFDLVKVIVEDTGIAYKDVSTVINRLLDAIKDSLKDNSTIELRGFGTFKVSHRASRVAYKPKGRDKLDIPDKYIPVFKPVKKLKDEVNDNCHKK
ncbi:MAG: integration host factor subunit beta [Candidatus Delongbacteria bacterium]|nr:integration host factor subunit beta [Candidatus Delongbacteria bacterium]MBN2834513.1 integration host factor subunit beta [Candidatus Delongbacteria bacterium]